MVVWRLSIISILSLVICSLFVVAYIPSGNRYYILPGDVTDVNSSTNISSIIAGDGLGGGGSSGDVSLFVDDTVCRLNGSFCPSSGGGTVTNVDTDDVYLYGGEITSTGTISLNETKLNSTIEAFGYITGYTETDPAWSDNSSTVARTGDCPAGEFVINTTTGGVECGPAITSTTYYANTSAVTGGSYTDTDNITDAWYYDGLTLNFTEGGGIDPLDIYINFTGVDDFDDLILREYYFGSSSHMIKIQLWDYNTGLWEDYFEFVGQAGFTVLSIPVFDPDEHINNTVVQVRLHHVQNGISSHRLYIDFVWLVDGGVVGGSTNLDGYAKYNFAYNDFFGNGSFNTTGGNIYVDGVPVLTSVPYQSSAAGWSNTSTMTSTDLDINITTGDLFVSNGNVGIGTNDPLDDLDVRNGIDIRDSSPTGAGSLQVYNDVGSSGWAHFGSQTPGSLLGILLANLTRMNAEENFFIDAKEEINIITINEDPIVFFIDSTEVMRIAANSYVGIGTINPTQLLDVNGSINISNSSGILFTPQICLAGDCQTTWPSGGGGGITTVQSIDSFIVVANSTTTNISFNTTAGDARYLLNTGDTATGNYSFNNGTLFIDSTNNQVGIGTEAPETSLHLYKDPPRITLESITLDSPSIPSIEVKNNRIFSFYGDDHDDQQFNFYAGLTQNRTYDGVFNVYGAGFGWLQYLSFTHSGNDGIIETGFGDVNFHPATGMIGVNTNTPTATLHLKGESSSEETLIIQGAASQSADLTQWQNNTGGLLSVVDEKGWMGIGIDDPAAPLDLQANNLSDKIVYWRNESGTVKGVINTEGHIGLGDTNPTSPIEVVTDEGTIIKVFSTAPTSRISIDGDGTTLFELKTNQGSGRTFWLSNNGATFQFKNTVDNLGTFQVRNSDNHDVLSVSFAAPDNSLLLDTAGELGIGTTSPEAKLDVHSIDATKVVQKINGNGTQTADLTQWKENGIIVASIDPTGNAYFAGSVGIGTETPTQTLDVNGTIISSNQYLRLADATGAQSIGTAWTALEWDTEIRKDSMFTHGANSVNVSIEAGEYDITVSCTVQCAGTDRYSPRMRIVTDTGGSFAEPVGSWSGGYSRTTNDPYGYIQSRASITLNDDDVIQVQAINDVGSVLTTSPNSCTWWIDRIG